MKMSSLLCSSPESEEISPLQASDPPENQPSSSPLVPKCGPVPDNQRVRSHALSVAQRRQRQAYQAYESQVYNLTLDINEVRQQIRQLLERRDLHVTRMLLNGERFKSDVLKLVWGLLDILQSGAIGLTPSSRGFFSSHSHISQRDPEASGGVHQFVMQQGPSSFSNHSFTVESIRVLAMVDSTTTGEAARTIRRVCNDHGGCVVEVLVHLSGRVTRGTFMALFPHLLSNEGLVSRLIGKKIEFSSRLLMYFNLQRRLMLQVAQADMMAALNALHIGDPSEFEALAHGDGSDE
ncbi:hypothetical protein P3T76_005583 [Phytophthora citrophthora]|uniref:Uncharacterized protein n=1 Tax=Phytophthora citrophthora TaxID=4793 RepID=A0AAD9GRQ1_9STRA|nr:hypothetical protein P3T76_005583 [Phytophthora citrophthora]